MPVLYFDTCALAKRYYKESGHEDVKRLIGVPTNNIVLSNIGAAEMSSVLWKKYRQGALTEQNAQKRLSRFIYDGQNEYKLYPVKAQLLGDAIGLIQKHGLRTLDAIHLATARRIQQAVQRFKMITSDKDLFFAADDEGMRPIDPAGNFP